MPVDVRDDPVRAFNFQVSLLDSSSSLAGALTTITLSAVGLTPVGGFSECAGLEGSLDTHDYMPGGGNGAVLKFPTRIKWTSITLKKGLTRSTALWDWFHGFVEGRGRRKDGIIVLQDEQHRPHTVWGFRRGLPVKYSGPSLNAGQSAVAIESVEIAHEGLYQMPSGFAAGGGLAATAATVFGLFG